jgi:transcriptional regulator with XRE-family HTH domain
MLRLKEIRLNKGLTQQELAIKLGITQQSIARYESEARKLDQDLIIKICLVLDVTPDELLGFEEAYKKYTEYLQSLDEEEQVN